MNCLWTIWKNKKIKTEIKKQSGIDRITGLYAVFEFEASVKE
jgi:hypothetical protein